MYKKTQAFTLIELLIVIAIIGILSAVLIPNLLSAKSRARDTVAQAYLREAMTMQEFVQLDSFSYSSDINDLYALGLKTIPNTINFTIVSAGIDDYCMSSTSNNGSGKIFYATAALALGTTVCP